MTVRQSPMGNRVRRGLGALLLWWLAAGISVLVPLLHWVLVPSLALLGPVMAARAFARDREVDAGSGTCPACGAALQFSGATRIAGFTHTCPVCRLTLDITALPDSSAATPPG